MQLFNPLRLAMATVALAALPVIVQSEVVKDMKLNFDPAPNGGNPSLLLEPNPVASDRPAQVRLTAYALDGEEEHTLATADVDTNATLNFVLPSREQHDILGVRVEKTGADGQPALIAAWRALYWPDDMTLLDYTGSDANPEPADFDAFWKEARFQLESIPMNPEITEVKDRETATGRLYRVRMNSYGAIPIFAWYYVPKSVDVLGGGRTKSTFPAVQIAPGYGAEEPPLDRTADGFITLSLNPRNHGPSKEFFDVGPSHNLWNIDDPEQYYYKAAFMDCVRGIDFLMSRPEVDHKHVGVEGGSQGGAFALATAALDKRVVCCAANIPYISNFPDFIRLVTNGSGKAFIDLMNDPEKGKSVRRSLALCDVSHMARRITVPTVISVGLQDRICPPQNGIVAYNRIPEDTVKTLFMDPKADHEVTQLMRDANRALYEEYLLGK